MFARVVRDESPACGHDPPPRQALDSTQHTADGSGRARETGLGRHVAVAEDITRNR